MLERKGEWDIDAFFASIPASKWLEWKVAKQINDSYEDWRWESLRLSVQQIEFVKTKPWTPPDFAVKKRVRRRLDGSEY